VTRHAGSETIASVRLFDNAADHYDAARPAYPARLYDLVESVTGPLAGKVVGDGGAGTGVVSRQLLERGAWVVAFDPARGMLGRAALRSPGLPVVAADAAAAPFRTASMELLCFGQSWHWVDQAEGAQEVARVLHPAGWWAAWWSHPWADAEPWFDRYLALLEERCEGFSRHQRDVDWCADAIRTNDCFENPQRHVVSWERRVTVEDWLTDLRSHSYVIDMSRAARAQLLSDSEGLLREHFGDLMVVPYRTRAWLALRR
jgi:SAM-dependent methyltransferase